MKKSNGHIDFEIFEKLDDQAPTEKISNEILSFVNLDLNPTHKSVFIKLLSIQAFIGFLTLLFCPQFQLSLTNSHQVFHYFHHTFGEQMCMILCGSIFIGTGAFFASYLLKFSEIKKIRESKFLYYISISSIALSSFMIQGAEIYLNLMAFWFIGACTSGLIMFEISFKIKRELFNL
jgi:hypothetical protein